MGSIHYGDFRMRSNREAQLFRTAYYTTSMVFLVKVSGLAYV